ncbi:MAG: integral rane protein [Actinoallomurus sp.]|nr:integral rane protein [Actinoallomurus sp.]
MSRRVRQRPPEMYAGHAGGPLAARLPARGWIVAALLAAALCGIIAGAGMAGIDGAGDLWARADAMSDGASRIRWGLVPVIAALTALNYLGSALGARAATEGVADRRLGIWEVTAVQFAGAAANRLVPGGLGSAAVTYRYLTRRGLPASAATAAVAVVGLVRGVTKLALVALAISAWSGLGGTSLPTVDLARLASRHSGMLVPAGIVVTSAAAALALAALYWRRRQAHVRARAAIIGVVRSLRHTLRRPGSLLTSLAATAGATLALTLAFAVSVTAIPGAGRGHFGALLAVYLIGATAGAAVPTPAGVGPTEAALIAALTMVHVPAAQAAMGVLLFRVITFWAPIPVGVLSTRWLRGQGAL